MQPSEWRRCAQRAGAEISKLAPACRKGASRGEGGADAKAEAEDDGKETSGVDRGAAVELLPLTRFGDSREHGGGQGGEHPPRP